MPVNNNQVAWEIVYGDQSIQWEMGHCKQKRNRRFRQLTLRTVRIGYKFKCIKNKNAKIKKYKYQIKTHRKSRWEVSLKIFLKIFFWILKFKRDFPKKDWISQSSWKETQENWRWRSTVSEKKIETFPIENSFQVREKKSK